MNLRELFYSYRPEEMIPVGSRIYLVTGRVLLVGDVNREGGVCDDCMDEDSEVEVAKVEPPSPVGQDGEGTK